MATKFEFDNDTIERFCNEYGVTIEMTPDQVDRLRETGNTHLLVEQLENIAGQICSDDNCLRKFIEQNSGKFHPVAMTLYILNDDLWKIMARKNEHPEKMLPMTTIPWFYWEKEAEGRKNPSGVQRQEHPSRPFTIKVEEEILMVSGKGGDFCGVLEGRIVDRHKGIRPIIIPGSTGPKKNVARYESEVLQIRIKVHSAKMTLYPIPEKELDYVYSEHPRVLYDHGILITADGEDVTLKVSKRKETTLRGKVLIFIGKSFEKKEESGDLLLFHVWLSMLKRTPYF